MVRWLITFVLQCVSVHTLNKLKNTGEANVFAIEDVQTSPARPASERAGVGRAGGGYTMLGRLRRFLAVPL